VETLCLSGSGGGEVDLDLFQHPRQRDGEREEGAVEIGGVLHFGFLCSAF
jgi:hypothetical protein